MEIWSVSMVWIVFTLAIARGQDEPVVEPDDLPRLPPQSVEEALKSFQLRPGFEIELVASEPQVEDPVAICFDPDGALYVCEMRGYSERRDEALGRVSRLTDEDGDGHYEKATVFAEGLQWPTGLICWDGGVFVLATPNLYFFKDEDGDGVAEKKEGVFTGFGEGVKELNVQALANSLTWGPNGRIYGSTGRNGGLVRRVGSSSEDGISLRGADFSFDPGTLEIRRESGTGQYGLAFDDWGQRYVCSNSRHLIAVMYDWPWNEESLLPGALVDIPVDGSAAEVFRASVVEPWRVIRTRWRVQGLVKGIVEGGGRASGYFTSASGLTVYRGNLFPDQFRGNVFVGDVGSNLVHRKILERSEDVVQLSARRAADEKGVEFLTSTDNWFRPVQCANGPDGALYIVDMYRETIEHPSSFPAPLKERIDLNSGNDRGRIWRVVPTTVGERDHLPVSLSKKSSADLEALLEVGENGGWMSDAADQVLVARGEREDRQLREKGAAWSRFELALSQLKEADTETLRELLEASGEDEWIGRTVAAASSKHGLVPQVFAECQDLDMAASLLRAISFRPTEEEALDLQPLFDRARKRLSRPSDVVLMGMDPATSADELWGIVDRGDPEMAKEAFTSLRKRGGEWEAGVLERWVSLPTAIRAEAMRYFGTMTLIEALQSELIVSSELSFSKRMALRKHSNKKTRSLAVALLGEEIVVSRDDALNLYRPALALDGDSDAGQKIFSERCAICHEANEKGVTAGPVVDSFRNQGKAMLLENLIQPNREVAPQFFLWEAELKSGMRHAGILVSENAETVTLMQAGAIETVLNRSEVKRLINLNQSLMTPGLESGLTVQQMADLLEYLKTPGGD